MKIGITYWCLVVLALTEKTVRGQDVMNCETESDIVFLVDSSLSIQEFDNPVESLVNWQIIKDFIVNITMRLPVESKIRVGVLKFSNKVDTSDIIRLGDYYDRNELKSKINNLNFLGQGTNTSGAIWYMNAENSDMFGSDKDRPEVPNFAVLITDGLSNRDSEKTIPYAREARLNHNTKMFTIGITRYANTDELQEIASDPISYYSFLSEDFRNLNVLLDSILTRMCPEAPPPRGACKDTRADIAFLVDASGSIGEENWIMLKTFVLDVMNSLDLSNDRTRIAVIKYSTTAEVIFPLDAYFGETAIGSVADMKQAFLNTTYVGKKTNITGALKLLRTEVFNESNGDRPDIKNIGILISDGKSTEDVEQTPREAYLLKEAGVAMFALGLTNDINELELTNISSQPLSVYYLNTTLIKNVPTLMSRLIWGLCIDQCGLDGYDDPSCLRNNSVYSCAEDADPEWFAIPNHILLGHNYDRLENVATAKECKNLCERDPKCRSVDYIRDYKQCAVSYIYKDEAIESFVEELSADYYEYKCQSEDAKQPKGKQPTNSGPQDRGLHGAVVLAISGLLYIRTILM